LETVAILGSPISPFFMDQLFCDLNAVSGKHNVDSVHLATFPKVNLAWIDTELETQMELAQAISSLVLGLRKKEKLRVRQPLQKIMVPALNEAVAKNIAHVSDLILSEVNVKELEILTEDNGMFVKSVKANFKTIGPKYGAQMKVIADLAKNFTQAEIAEIESKKSWSKEINGTHVELGLEDFEIVAQDIPGWLVSSENGITVALDITLNAHLRNEGIARELVNRVQNLRKDSGLDVTDRIQLKVETTPTIQAAIQANEAYVCDEVLADSIEFTPLAENATVVDLVEEGDSRIALG
jgi:isoleucyl-tRNA synthetase